MMKSRLSRIALVVTVGALAGCMGSFTLTKKLYGFNDTVTDSKIVNNVIFWGLNIVPVYSLAVTVDVVILNTIEFWTGTKLFADAGVDADVKVAVVENADGSLTVTRGAEVLTLHKDGDNGVRVYRDGVFVGAAVKGEGGAIVAKDAGGNVVAALDNDEAAAASDVVDSVVTAP